MKENSDIINKIKDITGAGTINAVSFEEAKFLTSLEIIKQFVKYLYVYHGIDISEEQFVGFFEQD